MLGEFSRSIVVRGLPCDTKVENYVLDLYMENIAGIKTSSINIGGSLAVVEFPKPVGKLYCIAGNVLGAKLNSSSTGFRLLLHILCPL